jgi:hypothetical protein
MFFKTSAYSEILTESLQRKFVQKNHVKKQKVIKLIKKESLIANFFFFFVQVDVSLTHFI